MVAGTAGLTLISLSSTVTRAWWTSWMPTCISPTSSWQPRIRVDPAPVAVLPAVTSLLTLMHAAPRAETALPHRSQTSSTLTSPQFEKATVPLMWLRAPPARALLTCDVSP